MAHVLPHSSLCSITAEDKGDVLRCVCECLLAFICMSVGFINLGLNWELLSDSSTSIVHDAFNKFRHKAASTSTQWLSDCTDPQQRSSHSAKAGPATQRKPTRSRPTMKSSCSEIHERKQPYDFPERKKGSPSFFFRSLQFPVVSLEFTSPHKHFDLELCWLMLDRIVWVVIISFLSSSTLHWLALLK